MSSRRDGTWDQLPRLTARLGAGTLLGDTSTSWKSMRMVALHKHVCRDRFEANGVVGGRAESNVSWGAVLEKMTYHGVSRGSPKSASIRVEHSALSNHARVENCKLLELHPPLLVAPMRFPFWRCAFSTKQAVYLEAFGKEQKRRLFICRRISATEWI